MDAASLQPALIKQTRKHYRKLHNVSKKSQSSYKQSLNKLMRELRAEYNKKMKKIDAKKGCKKMSFDQFVRKQTKKVEKKPVIKPVVDSDTAVESKEPEQSSNSGIMSAFGMGSSVESEKAQEEQVAEPSLSTEEQVAEPSTEEPVVEKPETAEASVEAKGGKKKGAKRTRRH